MFTAQFLEQVLKYEHFKTCSKNCAVKIEDHGVHSGVEKISRISFLPPSYKWRRTVLRLGHAPIPTVERERERERERFIFRAREATVSSP